MKKYILLIITLCLGFLAAIYVVETNKGIHITNEDMKFGFEVEYIYQDSAGVKRIERVSSWSNIKSTKKQFAIETVERMIFYNKAKWVAVYWIKEKKK